uniref:Uncharacterized protein n=1 Tax=Arion vulgaris TaxID=1028688 RepID=A0A0B7B5X7_9EUPU
MWDREHIRKSIADIYFQNVFDYFIFFLSNSIDQRSPTFQHERATFKSKIDECHVESSLYHILNST